MTLMDKQYIEIKLDQLLNRIASEQGFIDFKFTKTRVTPSNLLHRYREDGLVEVIPVDYQTVQGGCMIMDLFLLVFTGSDQQFRREHFDNLMELYYSDLKAAMTRLGLTDEDYSREDFDFELKEKLPCELLLAAFALPMVTVDTEDAPRADLGWENSSFADVKTSAIYPEIMN